MMHRAISTRRSQLEERAIDDYRLATWIVTAAPSDARPSSAMSGRLLAVCGISIGVVSAVCTGTGSLEIIGAGVSTTGVVTTGVLTTTGSGVMTRSSRVSRSADAAVLGYAVTVALAMRASCLARLSS